MATPTPCPGQYGSCKCREHYGFSEWAIVNLGKDYGLPATWTPKPQLRVIPTPEATINRTPAPQPWEPRPRRAA